MGFCERPPDPGNINHAVFIGKVQEFFPKTHSDVDRIHEEFYRTHRDLLLHLTRASCARVVVPLRP
jgi:hypothetical protein